MRSALCLTVALLNALLAFSLPCAADPGADTHVSSLSLTNTFAAPGFGYSIRYPDGWTQARPADFAVILTAPAEAHEHESTITLDNRLSPRPGEPLRGAAALLDRYITELMAKAKDPKVFRQVPFLYRKEGVQLEGYQAVTEFNARNERLRQWVVILPRRSGTVVHVWMFTTPLDRFEEAVPTAKAILDSWLIQGTD